MILDTYDVHEVNWYVDKLINQVDEEDILNGIRRVNEMSIAFNSSSRQGNRNYTKWRRGQLEGIDEIKLRSMNVFDRLRHSKRKGNNTIFAKLKRIRKGK